MRREIEADHRVGNGNASDERAAAESFRRALALAHVGPEQAHLARMAGRAAETHPHETEEAAVLTFSAPRKSAPTG